MTRRSLCTAMAWLVAAALAPMAVAQTPTRWPAAPLRIVVPAQPGSPSDIVARLIGERLGARSGQPVVIDNKLGASGMIGMREAAKIEPDGNTIVIGYDAITTVNPFVYVGRGFDPRDVFAPVGILSTAPQMLVCGVQSGITTIAQLMEQGRKQKVVFASGGIGSPGHLTQALLSDATGLQAEHVPYRGPGAAAAGVLGGEAACGFLTSPSVLPHVKAGKLNALAVSSLRPSVVAPDVKPVAEQVGRPSFDASFMTVAWVRKDVPEPLQAVIERTLQEIGADASLREKLAAQDHTTVFSSAAQARQMLQAAADRWSPVVRRLDLKPD